MHRATLHPASLAIIAALLASALFFPAPVRAAGEDDATRPVWWEDFQTRARRDGYQLADNQRMADLVEQSGVLVLDARPDYEFAMGHIPGAENLEFDLADEGELPRAKRNALLDMLGPDKDRPVAVYCRSFR